MSGNDGTKWTARREFLRRSGTACLGAWVLGGAAGGNHGHVGGLGAGPSVAGAAEAPDFTEFENGQNLKFAHPLPESSRQANYAFSQYLRGNVRASETLHKLASRIRAFRDASARLFISRCIDGRVHNSDNIGYPPRAITFLRTEGANVDYSASNSVFWNRLHGVMLDAEHHTPDCPAVFAAMGHFAKIGSGCAAHGDDDEKALEAVREQAEHVLGHYRTKKLFAVYGMINTDDGAERLVFPDGHEIDADQIIRHLDTPTFPLRQAADVFQPEFLDRLIDERETDLLIGQRPPREIVAGPDAPMFRDLQTMIAMEAYLVGEVFHVVANRARNNVTFQPRLFEMVTGQLRALEGLPAALLAPFTYQILWNVAHALHRRTRLAALAAPQRALETDHAETAVAYGEGFDLQAVNTLVLVKPGRGNDLDALNVAHKVILKHRERRGPQNFPPLVHVNIEVSGQMESWFSYNDAVLSHLRTMVNNVHSVFGYECRIFTSYSYRQQKRFYPVRLAADPTIEDNDERECYPADVGAGFTEDDFGLNELRLREDAYTRSLLGRR